MTCTMTDIPEITNITPIIGIYRELPEKTDIQDIKPPNANEPVSPINTAALLELNTKKAATAPNPAKHNSAEFTPFIASITPKMSR